MAPFFGATVIGHDGRPTQVSHASTLGDYPRIFTIDPFGLFMAVGNQSADNVTSFRVNPGNHTRLR
jgi:6-phosphogluconolactonase